MTTKPIAPRDTVPRDTVARDIDAYISAFPEPIRAILEQIRRLVHEVAPAAREAIKYQIPTFTLNGNLVHFGAFKKHIGFYPAPRGAHRMPQFSAYAGEKGTATFPLDTPIPYAVIREMIALRVEEDAKAATPKPKSRKAAAPRKGKGPSAIVKKRANEKRASGKVAHEKRVRSTKVARGPAKKATKQASGKQVRVRNAKATGQSNRAVSGSKRSKARKR